MHTNLNTLPGIIWLLAGVTLLSLGYSELAQAYDYSTSKIVIDNSRIDEMIDVILDFLEGSFGALIMVVSGIGAIISSAFGQYRAALGLLVVAVGCFILRSLVNTFFARPDFQY
jgi:hypothetical protein